jgi:hypothetical protein
VQISPQLYAAHYNESNPHKTENMNGESLSGQIPSPHPADLHGAGLSDPWRTEQEKETQADGY